MVMTSAQLERTLDALENLIVVIERRGPARDREELQALRALRRQRSTLRLLLKVRASERAKKVVSLERWRDGHMEAFGEPLAASAP